MLIPHGRIKNVCKFYNASSLMNNVCVLYDANSSRNDHRCWKLYDASSLTNDYECVHILRNVCIIPQERIINVCKLYAAISSKRNYE